jgi:hypothetical protein
MNTLLALLLLLLAPACITPTGGSPLNAYAQSDGTATLGYDLNTLIVVADGTGTAVLRDSMSKLTLYPPFSWVGAGVWVRIHSDDGGTRFAARYEIGEPLPAWIEPYAMAVFSLAEIQELGLTFTEQ